MLNFTKYKMLESKENNLVSLQLSDRFVTALKKINDDISIYTLKLLKKGDNSFDVSFIDVTNKNDTISFTPSSKSKPILDKYVSIGKDQEGYNVCWTTNRQELKIGRLVSKFFENQFSSVQVEKFINGFKTAIDGDKSFDKFEIEAIPKADKCVPMAKPQRVPLKLTINH